MWEWEGDCVCVCVCVCTPVWCVSLCVLSECIWVGGGGLCV